MRQLMKLVATSLSDSQLSYNNPLRGLTMSRVVQELEMGQRGDLSMLQWLYHFIEKRDATLRGAKRRILSALTKLDWKIKVRAGLSPERFPLSTAHFRPPGGRQLTLF